MLAMCFPRTAPYYAAAVSPEERPGCKRARDDRRPAMESPTWNDRQLTFGYKFVNEFLPGPERRQRKSGCSLYDLRLRDGKTQYRLYDRVLRNSHSAYAPFSLESFANGVEYYRPVDGVMTLHSQEAFPPVGTFDDSRPNRYQNPHLPFGGADIPDAGFSFDLRKADDRAPQNSRVLIDYRWR